MSIFLRDKFFRNIVSSSSGVCSTFLLDVARFRHAVYAVTHQMCRQALIEKTLCCYATLGGLHLNGTSFGRAKNANPHFGLS